MHIGDESLQRTEFYNDWMRHQDDLIGGVAMKTRLHDGRALVIAVNTRRQKRDETDARTRLLLDHLQPHISHAFEVSQVVAGLRARCLVTEGAPGPEGGTVITDPDFLVVWADPQVMSGMGGLLRVDVSGRLRFTDPEVQHWAAQDQPRSGPRALALRLCEAGPYSIRRLVCSHAEAPVSPLFPGRFAGGPGPSGNAPLSSRAGIARLRSQSGWARAFSFPPPRSRLRR